MKLKFHDSYKNDEKTTTKFEPINDVDVVNKACPDEILWNINCHISSLEKKYNEFKLPSDKQSIVDVLIKRAVKTTVQMLYDRGLFDSFSNAGEVLKAFLFLARRKSDSEEHKSYRSMVIFLIINWKRSNIK